MQIAKVAHIQTLVMQKNQKLQLATWANALSMLTVHHTEQLYQRTELYTQNYTQVTTHKKFINN